MRKELEVSAKNTRVRQKIKQVKEVLQEVQDDICPLRVTNEVQMQDLHPQIVQVKCEIEVVEARVQQKSLQQKSQSLDEQIIRKEQSVHAWHKGRSSAA
jgi:hypothetical protein